MLTSVAIELHCGCPPPSKFTPYTHTYKLARQIYPAPLIPHSYSPSITNGIGVVGVLFMPVSPEPIVSRRQSLPGCTARSIIRESNCNGGSSVWSVPFESCNIYSGLHSTLPITLRQTNLVYPLPFFCRVCFERHYMPQSPGVSAVGLIGHVRLYLAHCWDSLWTHF